MVCYYNDVKDKKNPHEWGKLSKEDNMDRKQWIESMNKEYEAKEELLKHCKYSHSALTRGYISRKIYGRIVPYKGRYGTGYKVYSPNPDSTRYCIVSYYLYP